MKGYKPGQKVQATLHNSTDFSANVLADRRRALSCTDYGVVVRRGERLLYRYEVLMNDGTITWFNEGELRPSYMTLLERVVMHWNNLWL